MLQRRHGLGGTRLLQAVNISNKLLIAFYFIANFQNEIDHVEIERMFQTKHTFCDKVGKFYTTTITVYFINCSETTMTRAIMMQALTQ